MQNTAAKDNPCKSFSPNIFNKSKCQNCFKPRETHLQSDKDLSKAKPVYVGWLLLAPIGTDFSNLMHKNRKWQRRWFVLFEHGALKFALDDNATTVAQGTIDMNQSTDVVYADTITNQKHSLAIFMPKERFFVRGENKEDIMGWHDTLVVFPETIKEEMKRKNRLLNKKRRSEAPQNAPLAISPVTTSYSAPNTPLSKTKAHAANPPSSLTKTEEPAKKQQSAESPRSRNSSTSSSSISSGMKSPTTERDGFLSHQLRSPVPHSNKPYRKHERDFKPVAAANHQEVYPAEPSTKLDPSYFTIDRNPGQAEPETQVNSSKDKPDATSPSLSSNRLQRNISISTSSLDSITSNHSFADSTDGSQSQPGSGVKKHFKDYHNLADVPKAKRISSRHYKEQRKELERKSRARSPGREEIDRMFGRERRRSRIIEAFEMPQVDQSNKENNEPSASSDADALPTSQADLSNSSIAASPPTPTPRDPERRGRAISRRSTNMKQGTQTEQPRINSAAVRRAKSLDRRSYDSIVLSADLFNVKKGWLTMQENGSWSKHWFVLGNKLLRFYSDSSSEDTSHLEGVIDLEKFVDITEVEVQRNYGFQIKTKEGTTQLAAMTSGIRKNWIRAIVAAAQTQEEVQSALTFTAVEVKDTKPKDSEPTTKSALDDSSITERSQRRRSRIRDRRKDGRSRTFDFAEFRPLVDDMTRTVEIDKDKTQKSDVKATSDVKARSRTFDADKLLSDLSRNAVNLPKPVVSSQETVKNKPLQPSKSADTNRSIESNWMKIENIDYDTILVNGDGPPSSNPINETASMVRALQSEVDSLKKQMERVYSEKTSEKQQTVLETAFVSPERPPEVQHVDTNRMQEKIDQQSNQIGKLKQELSVSQEALRKQGGKLRESEMQLDIALRESQLVETQLTNAQDEMRMEKSRREQEEKEDRRKTKSFKEQLEESDARLKKAETEVLESQRRIRELERQTSMQTNRDVEASRLQEHISVLRRHAEEQDAELHEMQEAYEQKSQSHKQLQDSLIEAKELITKYEGQLEDVKQAMQSTDKDITAISTHRKEAEADLKKMSEALKLSQNQEAKLMDQIARLVAQSQLDEDCNASLQDELSKEKINSDRLKTIIKERSSDLLASDNRRQELERRITQLTSKLRESDEGSNSKVEKLKEELEKSEQTIRELRSRLSLAEKQLGDIDELKTTEAKASASSLKAKVSELEAEMGDTSQMIAARISALERPRRDSTSSNTSDKEGSSQKMREKIQRLETELDKMSKLAQTLESRLKDSEKRFGSSSEESEKMKELQTKLKAAKAMWEEKVTQEKIRSGEAEEQLSATRTCLQHLHARALKVTPESGNPPASVIQSLLADTLRLASGDTSISSGHESPRSPSPTSGRQWQRVADAESRQHHQKVMTRLRQLTENLKKSDGRLVSPSASPSFFAGGQQAAALKSAGGKPEKAASLTDDQAAQLFAKQVSTQALLLAEMAATLRKTQSSPSLSTAGHQSKSRQSAPSPQFTSAEFSDSIAHHAATGGGLLQHVDALAQKLTLEGMLMREVARLRESWLTSRNRGAQPRAMMGGLHSECSNAMLVHAHVCYVLQVYNERISRLSLEARQARHRADATMRKLRELVDACKRHNLNEISDLAVQVDTDPIASPYSDIPMWEQQVDYGTLHGAQSLPSTVNLESTFLDQEATFFQQLADDLGCMSSDVQTLSKLGAQLLVADGALQKFLSPNEIGEHASTVAREAIMQAEVIYISHRLRRDYDEELRKAKSAVGEQAQHFENLKKEMGVNEEKYAARLKRITEENNSKVGHLMQEADRLERRRAEMSRDVDERLTRLSRKHEQELATCNAKHEQEMSTIRKDLATAHHQVQVKTKEYMEEVKALTERLALIKTQHSKEGVDLREDYERRLERSNDECKREVAKALMDEHEEELNEIKEEFDKRMAECEKIHKARVMRIEEETKADKEDLIDQHKREMKAVTKEHSATLAQLERDSKHKAESLKRDFDQMLEEERSQHKMALNSSREEAESKSRDAIRKKSTELKNEHEKVLEYRDKLHKEQLTREKTEWTEELRQEWNEEHQAELQRLAEQLAAASHVRSASMTSLSEGESKDVLRGRITDLEEQITSMQGQLKDEQRKDSYQRHFEELKSLCDQSFSEIEETHAKQLKDIEATHARELERIKEENKDELEKDREDTKRAIEIMRKHHNEEIREVRDQLSERRSVSGTNDHSLRREVDKLNQEIEKLSEYYSRKCVELASAMERIEKAEDDVTSLEREKQRLQSRNDELSQQLQIEMKGVMNSTSADGEDQQAGDTYQLQVKLRVKASEIEYLNQEVASLSQQLEESYKEKKHALRKHQSLFDELTLARSKEAMARMELARLKGQRGGDDASDSDSGGDRSRRTDNTGGYDFQKSRSQPDIPASPMRLVQVPSSSAATVSSVKRRSSDRSKRHSKI